METRKVLEIYPLPLARGYRQFRNAAEVRERHDAAYYLFEVYLKYAASLAIARYLAGEARDHRVNSALKGLARPSLGEWVRFLRECLAFLKGSKDADPAIQAIADLWETREARWEAVLALYNALRSFRTGGPSERDRASLAMLLEELVPYRNSVLGHGAPLSKEHYERFADLFGLAFPALLEASPFLTARRLVSFECPRVREGSRVECGIIEHMGLQPVRREKPLSLAYGVPAPREGSLYLLDERGEFLSLDPLLVAHGEDVYILNEAGGSPEYLSYSTGERYRPSSVGEAERRLFERILGYQVDETRLSRIGEDLALAAKAEVAPPEESERGLGDFQIVREIGRGAMGAVFEAVQESLGRRVALKVLPGTFALDPRKLERFHREARATARIHHPNIVPVYEVGESGGNHYYAMEYIDGPSLDKVLAQAREEAAQKRKKGSRGSTSSDPKTIAHAVEQMAALAEGLEAAHRLGLIHRDVKPSNILVDSGGRYILVDFGLVREEEAKTLTRSGELVGTVNYMSPEQVSRRRVDARSDVYSLGATLYEVLTLKVPFEGESEHEVQSAILFKEPQPPRKLNARLNRDLETIVLHALEKDPDRRYATAGKVAADLRRFLRYEPIKAKPRSALTVALRRAWRHKGAGLAALAVAALLLATAFFAYTHWRDTEATKTARYEREVLAAYRKLAAGAFRFPPLPGSLRSGPENLDLDEALSEGERPKLAEAAADLESACRLILERPEAPFHRARALFFLGEEERAIAELERLCERQDDFVPALLFLAEVRERRGEGELAGIALSRAVRSAREGWRKAWWLAERAMREGRWAEAIKACGDLLGLQAVGDPLFLGAPFEVLLRRGFARMKAKDFDGAIEDLLKAETHGPSPEVSLLLGKIDFLKGETARAQKRFGELHDATPLKDAAALAIADLYARYAEHQKEQEWIGKLIPGPLGDRIQASLLDRSEEFEEAERAARRAVAARPDDPLARYQLAVVLGHLEKPGEAIAELRKALEVRPSLAPAHALLGENLRRAGKGNLTEAFGEVCKAFEDDPSEWGYLQRLRELMDFAEPSDNGTWPEILIRTIEAVERSGKTRHRLPILYKYVNALLLEDDPRKPLDPRALEYARRGVEKTAGKDVDLLAALAEAEFRSGNAKEAVIDIEKAKRLPNATWRLAGKFDEYRRELLPDLVTYASIDAEVEALKAAPQDSPEAPRTFRAFRALEIMGSKKARECLEILAAEDPWPPGTPCAGAALLRTLASPADVSQEPKPAGPSESQIPRVTLTAPALVLDADFEGTMGAGWSPTRTAERPGGEGKVLGPFGNEKVTLSLESLPPHALLRVAFDLIVKGNWDGSDVCFGPDLWDLSVEGGPVLIHTTFGNKWDLSPDSQAIAFPQAYPDGYPGSLHAFQTGCEGTAFGSGNDDQRLCVSCRMDAVFPHTAASVVLRFSASNLEDLAEENWSLDDLRVEALPASASPGAAKLEEIWKDLAGEDAVKAVRAMWDLVASGDEGAAFLAGPLRAAREDRDRARREAWEGPRCTLDYFRRAATGDDRQARLAYLEGRIHQEAGEYAQALSKFEEAAALDRAAAEPAIRAAEIQAALGRPKAAEARLRAVLEGGVDDADAWDLWFRLSTMHLGRTPAQVLETFPKRTGKPAGGRGDDLRWLLEGLRDARSIRINCGGEEYRDAEGNDWGQDRFFTAGY